MGWWVGGARCGEGPPYSAPWRGEWGELQSHGLLQRRPSEAHATLSLHLGLLICDTGTRTATFQASRQEDGRWVE